MGDDVLEEGTDRKELSRHISSLIISCDIVASIMIGAAMENGVKCWGSGRHLRKEGQGDGGQLG